MKLSEFRNHGNKLAIDFALLNMPISQNDCLKILSKIGVTYEKIDIIKVARTIIGQSLYKRGATRSEWPLKLDCSALTKWVYGQLGIYLPRYSIEQYYHFNKDNAYTLNELKTGDLIFTTGSKNYYWDNPHEGIGHVGLASSSNSIIHAMNSDIASGVVECSLKEFMADNRQFRGINRIVDSFDNLLTLTSPASGSFESANEVYFKILGRLK